MIIYPPSIRQDAPERPVIIFRNTVNEADNDINIVLPIPQSIQFSDSASYNDQELGFVGSAILNVGRSKNISDAGRNLGGQVNSTPRTFAGLATLLSANNLEGPNRSAVGVALGTTRNKNLVTEFTGVETRQFSFQFKLISTSKEESDSIRGIIESFRKGLYPTGNSLQLSYPPTWYVNFKKNGEDIEYLPKIFQTYLRGLNTSYNSSMNMFHEDGSPVEVDLGVTFVETRALTLADIESLSDHAFRDGEFERAYRLSAADIAANKKSTDAAKTVVAKFTEAKKETAS